MQRIPIPSSLLAALGAASLTFQVTAASPASLTIQADRPGIPVSPTLYGLFFEEINCAGDGGLYAEMIRNRSFEDAETPLHWKLVSAGAGQGEISLDASVPLTTQNPRALKLRIASVEGGRVGVANAGYWGMAFQKGARYRFSANARATDGFTGPLTVSLEGTNGQVYARGKIDKLGSQWQSYELNLASSGTDTQGVLVVSAQRTGTVWFDGLSLFPRATWKGRTNGLRVDLAEKLAALKPAFVRFPGGCWVEGDRMKDAYRWKQTIGPLTGRRNQYNIWEYYSTHGLGYHEYLLMCEDLRAEPLFVINCGMSHKENVPLADLDPYVQDALDAIEYANGPAESTWGAVRARNGHPKPFGLKYLEIGNENGGPAYHERYARFYDALRAKYPEIRLIANVWGGSPTNRPTEIVDEHYYSNPRFFLQNANKYDSYSRTGPKVYVGEFAVTQGCGQGNLIGALGEAAFMTGLERNSDVVILSSYAPLFANVNYKKWNPDLIDFDNARSYGIPSYYVQKLFAENRPDTILPVRVAANDFVAKPPTPQGGIGLGTWETQVEYKDVRVTQGDQVLFADDFSTAGKWRPIRGQWETKDGVYRQTAEGSDRRSVAGDSAWTHYTYTAKARKLGGAEGFLFLFHVRDNDNYVWWNVGGWGNTQHALEMGEEGGKSVVGQAVPGRVETGRWYDVRIEVQGDRIQCFLDGKQIHDIRQEAATLKPLYAVAGLAKDGREIVLKVVNASASPQETEIDVQGVKGLRRQALSYLLTADDPKAENSLAEPMKVVPVRKSLSIPDTRFTHTFPPYSLTVVRLQKAR